MDPRLCQSNFYSLTNWNRLGPIDYFSLDVEGAEVIILESLKWHEVNRPGIITVEHNFRVDDIDRLKNLLIPLGYIEMFAEESWLRRGDLWFVHRDYNACE